MTTSTTQETRVHPITRFATRALEAAGSLRATPAWSMTVREQADALVLLSRAEAAVAELRLRVLACADLNDVASLDASPSTAAWYAHATRQTPAVANADVALARALDTDLGTTRDALADGRVNRDQALAITGAVTTLAEAVKLFEAERAADPAHEPSGPVPTDLLERAESVLVDEARRCDARDLRGLGRSIFATVAPDLADEAEGRRLAREEREAQSRMRFAMRDNGNGSHSGTFTIPDLHAGMLDKALDSLLSPRVTGPTGHLDENGDRIPRPELRGRAFCEAVERYPADLLPRMGGLSASVVVTVEAEALTKTFATASLDTGGSLSIGAVRRLACSAGILPAVLDGDSHVLDFGMERRLFSKAQKRALNLEHPACQAVGCSRPAAWCEAHHPKPVSQGGPTDLANAANLCPWHHHRAHDPKYDTTRLPDGGFRFARRT